MADWDVVLVAIGTERCRQWDGEVMGFQFVFYSELTFKRCWSRGYVFTFQLQSFIRDQYRQHRCKGSAPSEVGAEHDGRSTCIRTCVVVC